MSMEIIKRYPRPVATTVGVPDAPALVARAGDAARFAWAEFFGGQIENDHTRRAYWHAVHRFLAWCEARGLELHQIAPAVVGEYLRALRTRTGSLASKPTRKLHLAAIRQFFDRLVLRHVVILNPASSVRGPRHSVSEGKTPAISPDQARRLLRSIPPGTLVGLRDRSMIGVLIYTAARAGAVARLRLADFYTDGRQWFFRFDEKGGKVRDIPARHDLEGFVREYIRAAGIEAEPPDRPLFRTAAGRTDRLTPTAMSGKDILRMVKRRFKAAGLPPNLTCHTFRATTITDLLEQGVNPDDVQHLAGHSDPRTTRLYDRRRRQVTRNIVERISV
jgi:integrase/recombinase XerD